MNGKKPTELTNKEIMFRLDRFWKKEGFKGASFWLENFNNPTHGGENTVIRSNLVNGYPPY